MALLAELKQRVRHLKAETFDEAIVKLIQKEKKQALKSLFGALKGVKTEFVREKHDRFD